MNNLKLISLAVLLLAALSCGKESAVSGQLRSGDLVAGEGEVLCVTTPASKTSLNAQMKVVWDFKDRICLLNEDTSEGEEYFIKELSQDKVTAVFATSGTPVAGEVRHALYPQAAFKSLDAQAGTVKVDMSAVGGPDVSGLPMIATSRGSLFSFVNLCGALMVRPYDLQNLGLSIRSVKAVSKDGYAIGSAAVVALGTMSISSFEGEKTYVEMTLDEAVNISTYGWTSWSTHASSSFEGAAREFVVYVPCGEYPSGFDIVLTDADGRSYTYETGPQTVSPGVITRLPYVPLTTYYGAENCVRVAPGTKSVTVDITPYYSFCRRFERSEDIVSSDSPIVSSAQVLWQQEYGCQRADVMTTASSGTVISAGGEIAIANSEDGRQEMTLPLTGTAGNALVAVKDAAGTVLWSFHIWVSEASDVACSTVAGGDYAVMDRNLGATSADDRSQTTEELVRNSFGLFYQWGRKDPFPRVLHRTARVTANAYSAQLPFTNSVSRSDRTIGSISYTIRNPHQRIWLTSSGCNWLMSYVNELWGFHYSASSVDRLVAENQKKDGVKTVYDPCPAGYKVADAKHIKGLVDLNEGKLSSRDTHYGYYFDTGASARTYIPASGWVKSSEADSKALAYEGYWGMLWTSSSAQSNVHYMYLHSSTSAEFSDSRVCVRGHMCPVRCIKMKP